MLAVRRLETYRVTICGGLNAGPDQLECRRRKRRAEVLPRQGRRRIAGVQHTGWRLGGGSGGNSTIRISSSTTEHHQFFLRDASGHEREARVVGELALREGHDVSALWGTRANTGELCVAVVNHTTGQTKTLRDTLLHLAFGESGDRSRSRGLALIGSAFLLLWSAGAILGALSLIGQEGMSGAVLGVPLGAVGVTLGWLGWRLFRRPWRERDRKQAVFSKFESEVNAVIDKLAASPATGEGKNK